ncbi:Protein kinase [Vibrio crassostreae]|uniref:serine/threonine-protein kinase n=1 Tax=Vibrio crassostreae TaxID=246167 RepID=UPI00104443A7|nr:serine/threonine-protein kinase [Vibrio crassostreae]TCL30409.1 protein kinase-like protein [Vibrio crassostreae]CAK1712832.1 Protein kinase [Vibrio crassostreae]CAK1713964.1 Protein kinase [Vibrio crassostreae]CAK1716354.1 Protein kinase [Vibrio crassostreae]CAK1716923.1 Protein kinase [Vibrio crassostreae]
MILPSRYELSGTNDTGGMGDILYCKDNHLQRDVVIKLLKGDAEQRRLFDEQRSLIQLRSKHVVQLYDVVNAGEQVGLVLEFIQGNDLANGAYGTDMDGLVETLWQVACGLSDIHEAGIIHRDIKPNNIRRDDSDVIKVFDFGLARKLDSAKTNSVIGTVGYMAPELWRNGEVEFTTAVDVYAFGITAMALANANVPRELLEYPPLPSGRGWVQNSLPSLDSDIVNILERCLAYSPADRPTIAEVEKVLRRHLLRDKHKGLMVMESQVKELNSQNRRAKISSTYGTSLNGEITIEYDGYDFKVAALGGDVTVNNDQVNVGHILPGASVITLGTPARRGFVTFDISNPEVVS